MDKHHGVRPWTTPTITLRQASARMMVATTGVRTFESEYRHINRHNRQRGAAARWHGRRGPLAMDFSLHRQGQQHSDGGNRWRKPGSRNGY